MSTDNTPGVGGGGGGGRRFRGKKKKKGLDNSNENDGGDKDDTGITQDRFTNVDSIYHLTKGRIKVLNCVGFMWNPPTEMDKKWKVRFNKLVAYKKIHGT